MIGVSWIQSWFWSDTSSRQVRSARACSVNSKIPPVESDRFYVGHTDVSLNALLYARNDVKDYRSFLR